MEEQCGPHHSGQKSKFPDEEGKICNRLMDSMNGALRVLEYGRAMPWLCEGAPYEKGTDKDRLTTGFIRRPDATPVVVTWTSRRKV